MLQTHQWVLQLSGVKDKQKVVECKAVAYLYGEVYRICYSTYRQKYYFEIPALDYSPKYIEELALEEFLETRHSLNVAKCVRCGKWHVIDGQFCNRCKEALRTVDTNSLGLVELDIET